MTIFVGQKAIDFTSSAVLANGEIDNQFNLLEQIKNKYCILFFYPLDFTYVCPSELIALNNRINDFSQRNTVVIGISIDSKFTHLAWRNTPINQGGIGQLQYPLVADISHQICQRYEVEHPTDHIALRAAFLIDDQSIVRSQIINDLPLGRNIDELIRLVDAMQFHQEFGEFCQAGWTKGDTGIKPSKQGIAEFLTEKANNL